MKPCRLLAGVALVAGLLAASPASSQPTATTVKAEFLPRFARYVTWPPSVRPGAADPVVLCLIGGDPFGQQVDRAARGQAVDGHRIVIRRIASPAAAGGCHIAYLESNDGESTGRMLAALDGRPVLTVTDARNGSSRGIIHFTVANGRVRFFIDERRAAARGLTISSRLLALAVGVRQR